MKNLELNINLDDKPFNSDEISQLKKSKKAQVGLGWKKYYLFKLLLGVVLALEIYLSVVHGTNISFYLILPLLAGIGLIYFPFTNQEKEGGFFALLVILATSSFVDYQTVAFSLLIFSLVLLWRYNLTLISDENIVSNLEPCNSLEETEISKYPLSNKAKMYYNAVIGQRPLLRGEANILKSYCEPHKVRSSV